MTRAVVVLVTVANAKEAKVISRSLVEEKLAACVSTLPKVTSQYQWKGKIETGKELLLIIKTLASKYPALEKRVRQLHSYSVPEIIALPILQGHPAYLAWINESV